MRGRIFLSLFCSLISFETNSFAIVNVVFVAFNVCVIITCFELWHIHYLTIMPALILFFYRHICCSDLIESLIVYRYNRNIKFLLYITPERIIYYMFIHRFRNIFVRACLQRHIINFFKVVVIGRRFWSWCISMCCRSRAFLKNVRDLLWKGRVWIEKSWRNCWSCWSMALLL